MDKRVIATRFGPVPVWGAMERFSPERGLLLVIRGAFAELDMMFALTETFPDADVAYVHLPGMHSPFFAVDRIEDFAAAFDEVVAAFGHRRAGVVGFSLGGVVAMAMRSPAINALILLDTPLSTGPMWMLPDMLRPRIAGQPRGAAWVWNLLGVSETQTVNRDYRPILASLPFKSWLLLASDPVGEPRPIARDPSAVAEEDRELYRAHPLMSVTVIRDSGHQLGRHAPHAIVRAVRALLALD